MSKEKKKTSPIEDVQAWMAKHQEGQDLKALMAAVAVVERRTADTQAAANKLGEALEARKAALKALKAALKDAKAARKEPKKTPVAKKARASQAEVPKAAEPKVPASKAVPAKKAAPAPKAQAPKPE